MLLLPSALLVGQILSGQGAPPTPDASERLEAALMALDAGERDRVAVGVFGAPHVEADKLTRRLRRVLGRRYGARGRGFIDPKPTSRLTRDDRVRRRVRGDHVWVNGHHVDDGEPMSLSGHKLRLRAGGQLEITMCTGCSAPRHDDGGTLTLTWLNSEDAEGALVINGVTVAQLQPAVTADPVRRLQARVRGDQHVVEVLHTSAGGHLDILSLTYERDTPGVVVDALGLSGATGERFASFDADVLAEQVRSRAYDLVVFAWGTNEVGKRKLDAERYEAKLRATMTTVLDASPGAACVYFGPTDRLVRRRGRWRPAPHHRSIVAIQRRVAEAYGCGYFDAAQAMGGRGSMSRWRRSGLALKDNTHLTSSGYRRLADRFLGALLPGAHAGPTRRASAHPRVSQP
jgi:lysophospholipase L1-like esterase